MHQLRSWLQYSVLVRNHVNTCFRHLPAVCTCHPPANRPQSTGLTTDSPLASRHVGSHSSWKGLNERQLSSWRKPSSRLLHNRSTLFKHSLGPASRRHFALSPKAVLENAPLSVQPYLRLIRFDKPIGTMLLYWPCTWSIALAASPGQLPDLYMLGMFGAGAFLMRGAGCIINDLWDRDFDGKVERTRDRPLVSGELSEGQAVMLLGGMLSASLAILLTFNWYSVLLGASSMGLVITYPLMKRWTYWPQAVLGLTFNWGALLGWAAVRGVCDWSVVLPLYVAGISWTLLYDTIYAHQDKADDALIGVKSTALLFGEKTKPWLAAFCGVSVACWSACGIAADQTWPYFAGLAATSALLARQIYTLDINNPDDCGQKFRAQNRVGALLLTSIVVGTLLREREDKSEQKDS